MKAVQVNSFGSSSRVVQTSTVETPELHAGEVLVKVLFAPVNMGDVEFIEGMFTPPIYKTSPPFTAGFDFSGEIVEIHSSVNSRFKIGDIVIGRSCSHCGAFAQYITVPVDQIMLKPENLTAREAAALLSTSVVPYQALVETVKLHEGQKILILNGTGAVGTSVVQIAKHLRAYVIAGCTEDSRDFVMKLGAAETFDTNNEVWYKKYQGKELDMVFANSEFDSDEDLTQISNKASYVLKPNSPIIATTHVKNEKKVRYNGFVHLLGKSFRKGSTFAGNPTQYLCDDPLTPDILRYVHNISKFMKPLIAKEHPLDEAIDAILEVKQGNQKGKVILNCQSSNTFD